MVGVNYPYVCTLEEAQALAASAPGYYRMWRTKDGVWNLLQENDVLPEEEWNKPPPYWAA